MENKHIETEYLNDRTRDIPSFQILQIPINFHVLNFNRWLRVSYRARWYLRIESRYHLIIPRNNNNTNSFSNLSMFSFK